MAKVGRGIQSIEVGGLILSVLTNSRDPVMLKDISAQTSLAPAQCHAYLTSFRNVGLVEQDAQTGYYRLGPFAMRLGIGRLACVPTFAQAGDALLPLSREFECIAVMMVWSSLGPTVGQVQNGSPSLSLNIRPGTLFSVTGTASGQVFAAFGQSDEISRLIEDEMCGKTRENRMGAISDRESLNKAVKEIVETGYGKTQGVPIPGINAISAPVFDKNQNLALTVTLIARSEELTTSPDAEHTQKLMEVTSNLSRSAKLEN